MRFPNSPALSLPRRLTGIIMRNWRSLTRSPCSSRYRRIVAVTSARMTSFTLVPKVLLDGFDFCQRDLNPGELLRPPVQDVEPQPLRG